MVLMSLELMFNAVNLNLIAFSFRLSDLAGQVLAIFVITVAAAEAAGVSRDRWVFPWSAAGAGCGTL